MAWLLFMDESGHDHKNTPMEVRGGIAIHTSKIWDFLKDFDAAEKKCFGVELSEYRAEIKGSKLLEKRRYQWKSKNISMSKAEKYKSIRRFLKQSQQNISPDGKGFYAYGDASITMAKDIFRLVKKHDAKIFASVIPQGAKKIKNFKPKNFLRKDHIYLQERFFHFLESQQEEGILVIDQTEKQNDKKFVKSLQNYYTRTQNGISRTKWVVPAPLFVDSEMSPLIQAADLCIYCINWGYRIDSWNFSGPARQEISEDFGALCNELQFKGQVYNSSDDKIYDSYGIIYMETPY